MYNFTLCVYKFTLCVYNFSTLIRDLVPFFFLNECCFLLFIIINKSKQQITNHKSINPESSSLTASLNTPKSEAAVVAPSSSVPGILTGMRLGILSVLRASATHAAGGARVGGTVAGT